MEPPDLVLVFPFMLVVTPGFLFSLTSVLAFVSMAAFVPGFIFSLLCPMA
jgi:hypothetical protein